MPRLGAVTQKNIIMKKSILIDLAIFVSIAGLSFYGGYIYRQIELIQSTKELLVSKSSPYEVQDIEILIFGEPQL